MMMKKTMLCGAFVLIGSLPLASYCSASKSVPSQQQMSDAGITATIMALYAETSDLKPLNISVTTNRQHVMLTGMVNTASQYEKLIAYAESVGGVKDVNADHLKVKSSKAPLADSLITAKVKGRFLREKLFASDSIEYWPVKVETKDSVVYLSGNVSNDTQRRHLIELAEAVKGVKQVNSAITLG